MQTGEFLSLGADDVAPTGSIQQVYLQNSYGSFTGNAAFVSWITLRHPKAQYAGSNHGFSKFKDAIVEALDVQDHSPQQYFQPYRLALRYFDFSDFDLARLSPRPPWHPVQRVRHRLWWGQVQQRPN